MHVMRSLGTVQDKQGQDSFGGGKLSMSKIVRFKTHQDNIIEALEQIVERAKNGEITGFIFAAKCTDGNIATGWSHVDVGERNELTAHLQVDVMMAVVEANMDRLVEYV